MTFQRQKSFMKKSLIGKTFEKIIAAGGEIVQEKTKISDEYGFYSKFKDSCGNILGLWTRN